jgi:GTP diphosphokinase / guanosine-3',5'-bis(diphosphate) 3'-diphosphatase
MTTSAAMPEPTGLTTKPRSEGPARPLGRATGAIIRQYELVDLVKAYDPHADEELLNRAYVFAMRAHGGQRRATGEPFFSHPLEVAGILTRYRLDSSAIATALLHDTVEDTDATPEEIQSLFGVEIARLVNGVTKLSRIELQSERTKQAENLRKLVMAMSEDIRVLLIKLADRLHNMRTLSAIPDAAKRRRIANETIDVYAPLADRVGMHEVKEELQELAFVEINPDAYHSIVARMQYLREQSDDATTTTLVSLRETLAKYNVRCAVMGREKTPYSIWRKMQSNNIGFEQLSDVMAFRVIVKTNEDCYRALGAINQTYPVIPGRLKDYISTPKQNGYQSIHTGVIGPLNHRIEVQIRTRDMHEIADYGVAAHWMYKAGMSSTDGKQYQWLNELRDILVNSPDPDDLIAHSKIETFGDQVFCFTPKGDVFALPAGATAVDFAYAVHSEIGDRCVGAKINGRHMPLQTVLENGDQVEIITSKVQTPQPTWDRFVVTSKARARIRRFVRARQRDEWIKVGRSLVERAFRQEKRDYYDKALEGAIKKLNQPTVEDLLAQVGAGYVTAGAVFEAVFPDARRRPNMLQRVIGRRADARKQDAAPPIAIRGLIPGMAVHFAGCCHPVPGDRIVGITTTGRGITIHTIDCDSLEAYADSADRWIDVAWDADADAIEAHIGRVKLTVVNEPGTLSEITGVIAQYEGNITNLKITNRSAQFFDLLIDVEVHHVRHLTDIIAALRATRVVTAVDRAYA